MTFDSVAETTTAPDPTTPTDSTEFGDFSNINLDELEGI